jgi:hypothetical protein
MAATCSIAKIDVPPTVRSLEDTVLQTAPTPDLLLHRLVFFLSRIATEH